MPKNTKYTLEVIREVATDNSITSTVRIVSRTRPAEVVFECYGLELPNRNNARNISCIPIGKYILIPRSRGGFYKSYKSEFGHGHVYEIEGVDGRSHILIHVGNYPRDTRGCLLVGNSRAADKVGDSVKAYKRLYLALNKYGVDIVRVIDRTGRKEKK